MTVEMHCHTLFSVDGRGTPEDLVDAAAERGVTALAVTEHNHLGSLRRVRDRARLRGMRWMPGVEIDARFQGYKVHLLAFRFDPDNHPLRTLLQRNYTRYRRQCALLLRHLPESIRKPSAAEWKRFLAQRYPTHPDPVPSSFSLKPVLQPQRPRDIPPGQDWPDLKAVVRMIEAEQGPEGYDQLLPFEAVRRAVHAAGGVLLLAHVAQVLRGDATAQIALLEAALSAGADGFELWHPHNMAEPHFKQLEQAARRLECLVSGGSDSHSAPTASEPSMLGAMPVPPGVMDAIAEKRLPNPCLAEQDFPGGTGGTLYS